MPASTRHRRTRAADRRRVNLIRGYVDAYVRRHGHGKAAADLGVSRQTLWRFLERGHMGRSLPQAVLNAVDGNPDALYAATWQLYASPEEQMRADAIRPLPKGLEHALLLLAATPLTTAWELSCIGRIPLSTIRDRLERLTERGLVDSVQHRVSVLGPHAQRRCFLTSKGIIAGGAATEGREHFLSLYPVSRQWFRILAERLDAVAVIHHVAASSPRPTSTGIPCASTTTARVPTTPCSPSPAAAPSAWCATARPCPTPTCATDSGAWSV